MSLQIFEGLAWFAWTDCLLSSLLSADSEMTGDCVREPKPNPLRTLEASPEVSRDSIKTGGVIRRRLDTSPIRTSTALAVIIHQAGFRVGGHTATLVTSAAVDARRGRTSSVILISN